MEQTFFAKLPLLEECQVLVAGAGPAGLCAAVSAAREGCDVLLIEKLGSVGGALTAGHIRTCMGGVSEGTMRDELGKLLETEGACIPHDTEKAKYRLALWLKENGVRLLLGVCVCGVTKEASSVTGVVVATADGLMRIDAKEVIDATGDGTVAVLAGVPFEKGRASDGLMQPASI
ncbi:MAG: FAD-dependent oxidoreductase, partial [Oscillospiraceae bacterium]|nr:FAD-dependent oxidoreductase [Oscillospiraceae bacterium]